MRILTLFFLLFGFLLQAEEMKPEYLYKIISLEDWQKSQDKTEIPLGEMDKDFIHLATEVQVEKIASKFFANASEVVILKLNVKKLPGRLIYESNPGGANKYYHLYEGSIPLKAVESHVIKKL